MHRGLLLPVLLVAGVTVGLGGALASASSLDVDAGRLHSWQQPVDLHTDPTRTDETTEQVEPTTAEPEPSVSEPEPTPAPTETTPAPTEPASSQPDLPSAETAPVETQDAAVDPATPSIDPEASGTPDGDGATKTAAPTG